MSIYRYKAKTNKGQIAKGTLEAANEIELIKKLKENDLYCYEAVNSDDINFYQEKKIKTKDLVDFCYKISTMLKSGVSLSRTLMIIYESSENKHLKKASMELYEGVQKGQSLSDTMKGMNNKFPSLLIYMIEIGESSGNLDSIMTTMSEYYDGEHKVNNKIRTAMIYPIILGIVSVISVTFMVTFVLPQFVSMFEGNDLPMPTKILLGLSELITTKWWLILLLIAFAALGWTYFMKIPSFKLSIHEAKLKLPVIGKLIRTVYTYRFASSFSILFKSGVPVLTCLEITSKVIGNAHIQNKLNTVMDGLRKGDMLSEGLAKINVFDKMLSSMVLIGEEAGTLDETLFSAGKFFQKEADTAIMKMVALIEPLMIVVLAIIIGFIVISIILPIYSMYTQIQ
ncbi:MAG: type II secretion system F family protein [Sedimentibacter sp.]